MPGIVLLPVVILFSLLTITGCNEVQLETITVQPYQNSVTVTAGFSEKIPCSVNTEQNGTTIVLRAPGAVLSEIVPEEKLISGNDIVSGWFTRNEDNILEVRFYLTKGYEFRCTNTTVPQLQSPGSPYAVQIEINSAPEQQPGAVTESTREKPEQSPLMRGIALFHEGRYDEALTELNAEVGRDEHCPLAYYYAARIRLQKNQYDRARRNLLSALRDSTDFTDAVGFLAFTLKEQGQEQEATAQWQRFLSLTGATEEEREEIAGPVMQPELYRGRLDSLRREHELAERERERLDTQAILEEQAPEDSSSAIEPAERSLQPPVAESAEETDESLLDILDQQLRTDIRKGIYGIVIAAALLTAGIAYVIYWQRKRSLRRGEVTFAEEIGQFLQQRDNREEVLDIEDEYSIHEYHEKRKILNIENKPSRVTTIDRDTTADKSPEQTLSEIHKEPAQSASYQPFYENTSGRQPITEEIKALVTRMHREDHSIEEICRAADLTKTEVELIIAVRAKHMEQLIEEVSEEDEDFMDADHLYLAIRELKAEGETPRMIAKKLGISTSEINFALAVMREENTKQ